MTMTSENNDISSDFTPIRGFDATSTPPEAPAGEWGVTFAVTKRSATKEGGFPMLTLDVTLETANDEDNKASEGTHLRDWLTIYPPGMQGKQATAARIAGERLVALAEALGFDPGPRGGVIPQDITSFADLDGLVAAIDGQRATAWTRVDKRGKTVLEYRAPKRRN